MAKIAARTLGQGEGWRVAEVVCASGPADRPYEERHERFAIAVVTAGTFQYRKGNRRELMAPGSLMLGAPGQSYECGHEHGVGDRCLSFWYSADSFQRLAAGLGAARPERPFAALRIPPLRPLSAILARAAAGLAGDREEAAWEEIALALAARTVAVAAGLPDRAEEPSAAALARVTRVVRRIEAEPEGPLTLAALATEARLSTYHFLRTFVRVTGLTPHQYVRRRRLRAAAAALAARRDRVLDVALDAGFGDLSNFNRAFRAEFGLAPRAYRRAAGGVSSDPARR